MPNRARVHYNLGLLLQQLVRLNEAETALRRALEIEPDNMDYLYAMADYYLRRGQIKDAGRIARRMMERHPGNPLGQKILRFVEKEMNRRKDQ
jgi:tetratricopeptide (TPR) repeat protein